MKAAALRQALSDRAGGNLVHVVSSLVSGDTPKTKGAARGASARSPARAALLVVVTERDELTWLSLRNAPEVHLLDAGQLNTYDVLVQRRHRLHQGGLRRRRGAPGEEREGRRLMEKITDPRDIIIKPIVSEKSYGLIDEHNKYTFLVKQGVNKTQVKIAIEQIFGVKVTGVNTINRQGKRKRTKFGYGERPGTKRAIVSLAEGERIDIFGQIG